MRDRVIIMTFKTSAKRIFKNKIIMIAFAVFFVAVCAVFGWYLTLDKTSVMNTDGVFGSVTMSLQNCQYVFVFFVFFAYEACQAIRKEGIRELLNTKKIETIKLYFSHIIILLLFALIIFSVFFIYNIISYYANAPLIPYAFPQYIHYIFYCLFIYVFLVSFCAICIGVTLCAVFNRVGAYISIVAVVALIVSSSVESIAGIFAMLFGEKQVFKIIDIFSILPAGISKRVVFQTAYSILPDRVFTPCLLSAVFVFILLVYLQKKRVDIKGFLLCAVSFALCVLFAVGLMVPQSRITYITDHPSSSFLSDVFSVGDQEIKKASFKIIKYHMELSIKRELFASVTVTIDNAGEPEIDFTLWNAYKVSSVTDGKGDCLEYKQNGNYITVSNTAGNNEIIFQYKGHANRFFSNAQATYLAGYFPYYPIPGKCSLTNPADSYSFNNNSLDYSAEFDISVETNQTVFSNINRTSENSFKGAARSATLMTGFIDEVTIKGVKLIYPYTAYEMLFRGDGAPESFGYKTAESAISNLIEYGVVSEGDCVIVRPSLSQQLSEKYINCADTIFIGNVLPFKDGEDMEEALKLFNYKLMDISENSIGENNG